jgi:Holliday junction resolvasome RuvABC endonuclease subunit
LNIIGIDPGSAETAYCIVRDDLTISCADKLPNGEFIYFLRRCGVSAVAVEGIQSYGMAVGREVFDTCYMVGRILQTSEDLNLPVSIYNRPEYSKSICGVGKVTDAVLRSSLMARFGGDKKGEALHLLKGNSDKRSAFAIAVYHADLVKHGRVK